MKASQETMIKRAYAGDLVVDGKTVKAGTKIELAPARAELAKQRVGLHESETAATGKAPD